jgi:thioredoxin reductase/ferredoxin
MMKWVRRYARWLHTQWPAGTVEKLPEVGTDGATNIPGVYVVGDLTGIPLLKFALDSGARVVARIAAELAARPTGGTVLDVVILGGGVAGMAAAVEAARRGLSFVVLEATEPFSTLVNFPRQKPIYTYPSEMKPAGELQVSATVKEELLSELQAQVERAGIRTRAGRAERIERTADGLLVHLVEGAPIGARRVVVAIGRSGNFRQLGVPGEGLDKVYNRLHDPRDFRGQRALVVGGGDSALEAAIALVASGAQVTLSYRKTTLSRPKPDNLAKLDQLRRDPMAPVAVERPTSERVTTATGAFLDEPHPPGRLELRLGTEVRAIRAGEVELGAAGAGGAPGETCANDVVFVMIGREAPLDFFRRSGIAIAGELTARRWLAMGAFLLFCTWLYNWKSGGAVSDLWYRHGWFPVNLPQLLAHAGAGIAAAARVPQTLIGTLAISAASPAFFYTLAYSILVVVFGIRRIRRRRTPYVTVQTFTLMAVQVVPLFLLPEIILPQLNYHGLLPRGLADALFPVVSYGHGREFWRAYGLILAWPLNVYNVFSPHPLWWWLGISAVQTLVLIPLAIYYFGKGAYCGWVCSCGALAETLGDTQRHKMPHGPGWNRLNLAGQLILALACVLLVVRIFGWALPAGNWIDRTFDANLLGRYKWIVDVGLAGVLGYGTYFWLSGRLWCRTFCPLAALMHIYSRFSRFRILADKKKCISCNVCTSVCHMGIDVMNFANKGLPMRDPECVRCSACVQSCPTGTLSFGQVAPGGAIISIERLRASSVRMRERRTAS